MKQHRGGEWENERANVHSCEPNLTQLKKIYSVHEQPKTLLALAILININVG